MSKIDSYFTFYGLIFRKFEINLIIKKPRNKHLNLMNPANQIFFQLLLKTKLKLINEMIKSKKSIYYLFPVIYIYFIFTKQIIKTFKFNKKAFMSKKIIKISRLFVFMIENYLYFCEFICIFRTK